jgi:hypothetical protein
MHTVVSNKDHQLQTPSVSAVFFIVRITRPSVQGITSLTPPPTHLTSLPLCFSLVLIVILVLTILFPPDQAWQWLQGWHVLP